MLNFNQLRVFFHAAKHLNFTHAARELFITQPAVTAQVKSFEEWCNLKLFKKKGKNVHLTDEGKALYKYAAIVFDFETEIENVIDEMKKLKRGMLRLGTTKTYARYFMPLMISTFHETYPDVKINLSEGSSLEMIQSLLDLKIEIGIIAKAQDNPNVYFTPFSQEEMVVIMAPGHHLSNNCAITFEELAREPFIMKTTGSGTRRIVDRMFSRIDYKPNILMETSNTEFIKQLVGRGEGVSFLVKEGVAAEIREKKLATVPLKGNKVFLDVSIAYLKDQQLSPPARAFLRILEKLQPKNNMPPQGIGSLMAKILAGKIQAG